MSEGQTTGASLKLLALLGIGFATVYVIIFHTDLWRSFMPLLFHESQTGSVYPGIFLFLS